MDKKLAKIYKIIEESFAESDYRYHILPVVKYAKELAWIYKANAEIVEIAALLHDIGRIDIKNDAEHHILGVPVAEKILQDLEYPEEIIEEVKHCVASHRASQDLKPQTLIAKIIANADAMSHFDMLPIFYFWNGQRNTRVAEITDWVEKKFERNWEKKLTFPEAKKLVEKKYAAAKIILAALNEHENNLQK
ncbi:HD domain-containing protein [Patescibacteria group bacterium]|nr:HD domain-containing protein [Patescibacteria group bacterium]